MTALEDYVTTHEAAKIIGVSHSQVTRYCASGDLPSIRPGHEVLIKRRDAKRFKRPPRGNPNYVS